MSRLYILTDGQYRTHRWEESLNFCCAAVDMMEMEDGQDEDDEDEYGMAL